MIRLVLPLAIAIACAPSEPETLTTVAAPDCTRPSGQCAYAIASPWKDDLMHRKASYLCAAYLAACSGNPKPPPPSPPIPVSMGGSAATGGTSTAGGTLATGGKAPAGGTVSSGGTTAAPKCQAYCDHLAALGCPTQAGSCVKLCTLHTSDPRFGQNLDCVMAATSVSAAQKCGPAACR